MRATHRFGLSPLAAAVASLWAPLPAAPAIVNWTSGTGFWDVATNWSSSPLLPGAADDVVIAVAGLPTITHRVGATTINSLAVSNATLAITGGALTVAGAYGNNAATSISAGTLTLNGTSTLGSLAVGGGTLAGSGAATVAGGSTWTAGGFAGSGTTRFDGPLAISGAATKAIGGSRVVTLAGSTTWSGNTGAGNNALSIASTARAVNTGTFTDGNAFDSQIAGGTFDNSGRFTKQSATTTTVGTVFNNSGIVDVNAGTLLMQAGGTSTGSFNLASGAKIEFRNGVHTLNGVTMSGAGTFQVSTENVGADASVVLNGGTLGAAFLMSGSTLSGTSHVFQGPATWTGGTITGNSTQTSRFDGTLTISGAGTKSLSGGRRIVAGDTTWTGNTGPGNNVISISNAGAFTNSGRFVDANAFDSTLVAGGGGGTFDNAGTFTKQTATTTSIGTVFNSTGTVDIGAGTLLLHGGGTDSGTFNIAGGAKLEFRNGNHTLNGVTTGGAGSFEISTENVGADAFVALNGGTHTARFVLSGSTLGGTDHAFQNLATWSGGTITGAASTTFANDLTISGPLGKALNGGRRVNAGNVTWTGNTGAGNNVVSIAGGAVFTSSGTFTDANAFDSVLAVGNGGGTFASTGVFDKLSSTTTSVGTAFNSSGTVNVRAGTLLMHGGGTDSGTFNIAAGAKLEFRNGNHTLNGVTTGGAGSFEISTENVGADAVVAVNGGSHTSRFVLSGSTMAGSGATFQGPVTWSGGTISGAATTVFANEVAITGPNLKTLVGGRTLQLDGTTTWSGNTADNNNAIRFWNGATVRNNGSFNDANAFASFIEHNVGGPHTFDNAGIYNKLSNTLTTVDLGVNFANSGTLNLDAGTMRFVSGTQGPAGTINVAAGATYQHDAASTVGRMVTAGNLVLADRTLTVFGDYDNANVGSGNAFNRRANVSTTGTGNRLIAAGDANQALVGAGIGGGATATPTITIGNVRVGANTFSYDIVNTGSTGPVLRGAIQDAAGGGSITDPRLSGSGVQAGSWGPLALGASTSRDIVITVGSAGVYAPLAGQAVSIVNNFENTRSQLLTVASAAGAAAYNAAIGSVASPVTLANQRVGGTLTQALAIANTQSAGSFSEDLNASVGGVSGLASASGAVVGRRAGTGNTGSGEIRVGVDTGAAGARSGSVTVAFQTAGTVAGVGNGLAPASVGSGNVAVTGNVYQVAQPDPAALPATVELGNVRAGSGPQSRTLSIVNTNLAPAGFQEGLAAVIGPTSGAAAATGFANAAAGTSGALQVGLAGIAAGANAGTVQVQLQSNGVTTGGSNGLGSLNLGAAQTIAITGTGWRLAQAGALPAAIDFGNVLVGSTASQFLTIANTAVADGFSERLDARFRAGGTTGDATNNGGSVGLLAAGATNGGAMAVGVHTGTIGAKSGQVVVAFDSNGAGTSGLGITGLADQSLGVLANVTATVGTLAQPSAVAPNPVNFGNLRVGAAAPAAVALTISNGATIGEGLNASIATTSAGFGASGAFTGLAPGTTDAGTLKVGFTDTASAGAKSGTATVTLVSDGSFNGGTPTPLPSQTVALSANVFRLASGAVGSSAVDLGAFRVGGALPTTQTVSVRNTAAADGFSEQLGIQGVAGGGPAFTVGNALGATRVNAGATTAGALTIGAGSGLAAGVNTGSATVQFLSDGTATGSGSPVAVNSQAIDLRATGYVAASGQLVTPALNFGVLQVGQQVGQSLVVRNTATGPAGYVEDLNASFGAAGNAQISGSGSLSGILAGEASTAANGAMTVTVTGLTAGALTSSIRVDYTSAGAVAGVVNGLGTLAVGGENYGVAGTIQAVGEVVNQASPRLDTPVVTLAARRVGDAAASGTVGLTNVATAAPQAALSASIASTGAPVTASGSVTLLAPGASNASGLVVGLATTTAGDFSGANAGRATITLVSDASNVGCTSNCQLALAPQTVDVAGKVYTSAVGQSSTAAIDFGIVRVGDSVAARQIVVANGAELSGLNDTLRAQLGGVSGPFTGNGGVAGGITAQASGAIAVGLSTSAAGVYAQTGAVGFLSQNPDMADVSAGPDAAVTLRAQVNALANADFDLLAGLGTLSELGGGRYLLDLGTVRLGASVDALLQIDNDIAGPADDLQGLFDLAAADDFSYDGWALLAALSAGEAQGGLRVNWLADDLGLHTDTIVFDGRSVNASDPDGVALSRSLLIRARVVDDGGHAVPEPATASLLLVAAAAMVAVRRRRRGAGPTSTGD